VHYLNDPGCVPVTVKRLTTVYRRTIIRPNGSTEVRSEGRLYTDFDPDIWWIQGRIRAGYETLPAAVQGVAWYYLTERIKVLCDRDPKCSAHHLSPRPIPYLALWFARAFGLEDARVRRLLGLSLVYVCLSSTPRDDLLDGSRFAPHQQNYLARWFWEQYFHVLTKLFSVESPIWHVLSRCTADWARSDRWALYQNRHQTAHPLSANFLRNTSKYLAALIFPTLAGVALLSNRPTKLDAIRRFAYNYCMGWRILDDLRDWQEDSLKANIDGSCVLSFLRIRAGIPRSKPLTRELAVSLLSDQAVVGQIYSAMTRFYLAARREAESLHAGYVTRFIDEQLQGHEAELARMTAEKAKFRNSLAQLLEAESVT